MRIRLSFVILSILWMCGIIFTYANTGIQRKAQYFAEKYIENSLENPDWNKNNPRIESVGIPYYVESDQPSYIEFQVVCDNNPFCGTIIVNMDGHDVKVPIATTWWVWPSKILTKEWEEVYTKIYYFWPFNQWSVNERTGEVQAIDPQHYPNGVRDRWNQRELQEKFYELKNNVTNVKESEEFQSQLQKIKEMEYGFRKDDFAYQVIQRGYAASYSYPGTANKTVTWSNFNWCWLTPCYEQFQVLGHDCPIGCGPVAVAIVFWYHQKNSKPFLFPAWYAPSDIWINNYNVNTDITTVIEDIHTFTWTSCLWWGWYTSSSNMIQAKEYPKAWYYKQTTSESSGFFSTDATLFTNIKNEVIANRPIILRTRNHYMVVFGYNPTANNRIIRVNLWWWKNSIIQPNYATWDINYDMNSIYYNWSTHTALTTISYDIK